MTWIWNFTLLHFVPSPLLEFWIQSDGTIVWEAAMSLLFFAWQYILLGFALVIFCDVPQHLNSATLSNDWDLYHAICWQVTNTYLTLTKSQNYGWTLTPTSALRTRNYSKTFDLSNTHKSRSFTHVTQRSVMWPAPLVPPANEIIPPSMRSRQTFPVSAQLPAMLDRSVLVWP